MKLNRWSNRISLFAHISVGLATVLLMIEYWLGIEQYWAVAFSILGLLWYSGQRWNIEFIDGLMLVIYTLSASVAIPVGGSPFLALCVILLSLSAWQLANFSRRIHFSQDLITETRLAHRHLTRLLIINGSSLLLCSIALFIRFEPRFWWLIALALLAIIGLSQFVGYINRQID